MDIRNRNDAEFILRHRAAKEMGRRWKNKGRWFYVLLCPLLVYAICLIVFYPNSGQTNTSHIPESVSLGFLVLLLWAVVPAFVALVCFEKDKELLTKKYMDEATRMDNIDSENTDKK